MSEILLRVDEGRRWLAFSEPLEVLESRDPERVLSILGRLEDASREGLWAAGFLTYEAAPAFDSALAVHPPGPTLPLIRFGLYRQPREVALAPGPEAGFGLSPWRPLLPRRAYEGAIRRIKELIAAGDTYQANLTFQLQASFEGDPRALFASLARAQQGRYSAFLDLGQQAICSASPELFFRLEGDRIMTRPMKGTAPRGLWAAQDRQRLTELRHSVKNRAENLMIVDMVRNDLGRIADPGSVEVDQLFAVERYPTLLQMTSTVTARTRAALPEILRALFPCASITGAPKIRTMEILRQLEAGPRGVYTGTIGYLAPGRRAQFNVAIRTVTVDRIHQRALYGTGGGVVWDSSARDEYAECQTKALVLGTPRPRFRLLETLRWRPVGGPFLLDRHLARLGASAEYFGFPFPETGIRQRLAAVELPRRYHRLRLLLDEDGRVELEWAPLDRHRPRRPWRLGLAAEPVDPADCFLYHKTTHRAVYEGALAAVPGRDDALLWNERGELTETTRANLVLRLEDALVTPPISSGLLPGTYREALLARGRIREQTLRLEDLERAQDLWLVNSLRGWIPARIVASAATVPAPVIRHSG